MMPKKTVKQADKQTVKQPTKPTSKQTSKQTSRETTGRRANNAGTLIKMDTGLFLAKWCYQGKTMVRSTKTHDRDEALKKLDEFVRPYMESNEIAVLENLQAKIRTVNALHQQEVQKKNRVLLTDLFDKFIEHPNTSDLSPDTEENYKNVASIFVKWIEKFHKEVVTADQMTTEIAEEFLTCQSKRISTSRYNHILKTMSMIFKVLKQRNVWAEFKTKEVVVKYPRRALTKDELKKVLDHIAGVSKELRLVFTLAIYTGLRLSDCCTLKWQDIDLQNNLIRRLPNKTKKNGLYVTIPIHKRVRKCLEEFERGDPEDYVSMTNAHFLQSKHINWQVDKVMSACGLKSKGNYYGLHVLRHTFCTLMANNGVPMPVLQNMMGHSKPDMTMRYYHFDTDVAVSAIKRIAL